jgi:fluoride exporter
MVPWWWALTFVGGGLGSVLRAGLTAAAPAPWGTVLVNLTGSAVLAALAHPSSGLSPAMRMFFGVGVLGGFTTYSTFNLQVYEALMQRRYELAAGQLVLTVGGSLLAGLAAWIAMDQR